MLLFSRSKSECRLPAAALKPKIAIACGEGVADDDETPLKWAAANVLEPGMEILLLKVSFVHPLCSCSEFIAHASGEDAALMLRSALKSRFVHLRWSPPVRSLALEIAVAGGPIEEPALSLEEQQPFFCCWEHGAVETIVILMRSFPWLRCVYGVFTSREQAL